jgi:anti-sigma factor RsiW
MTARCPSDLALERHLLEPEGPALQPHLAGCSRCAARLEEMRRQGEDFQRFVYPATVEAVEAAAWPGRRPWLRWLALGGPALAAAAAAVVLMVRPWGPPDDYLGVKGSGGLGIAVFVQEAGAVRVVGNGEAVRADAAVRFRVRAARTCRLWILSLDARGEVSRLYPGEGTGGAEVSGAADIPGGAVLDGQPGPERIYAVCTPGPSKWRALAAQLKGGAGPGEASVRAPPPAAGLPEGTLLATVLLEKRT